MSGKEDWICNACYSSNIHHDADVQWDADAQDWTVMNVKDTQVCVDCGGEAVTFGIPESDEGLTPEQLDDKYNPEGNGEHPRFKREAWRHEVFESNTLRGYWQWVEAQIEEAATDKLVDES